MNNSEPTSVRLFLLAFTLNFVTTIVDNYDVVFKILTITALALAILLNGGKIIYNIIDFFKTSQIKIKSKLKQK